MTTRTRNLMAVVPWGSSVLAFAVAIVLLASGTSPVEDVTGDLPFVSLLLLWGALGALLAIRVPANPIGWLFCLMGTVAGLSFLAQVYGDITGAPGRAYAAWAMTWSSEWIPPLVVVLVMLFFPTGRLRTRIDAACGLGALVVGTLGVFADSLAPGALPYHDIANPFGVESLDGVTSFLLAATAPLMAALVLTTVISMFFRFRRSGGVERQQLKWFFLAAVFLALDWILASIVTGLGNDSDVGNVIGAALAFASLLGLAVAITVAILRYRLYDIDVIINRALVYGALSLSLLLAYIGLVVLMRLPLDRLTGESDLAVAASTLAVAALIGPLRARFQSFVDRRFYRRKYDAGQTLEGLKRRLRDEVEIGTVRTDVLVAVRETVQPSHASLWLRAKP